MKNQENQKLKNFFKNLFIILAVIFSLFMVIFILIYMVYELFGTKIFTKLNMIWFIDFSQTSAYICGVITAISVTSFYILNKK